MRIRFLAQVEEMFFVVPQLSDAFSNVVKRSVGSLLLGDPF